jgi:hypothetical protein
MKVNQQVKEGEKIFKKVGKKPEEKNHLVKGYVG